MAAKKYIDYAISAIHHLRGENGNTVTEIVRHIKATTGETNRRRLLFAKVRAATDKCILSGLLTRYRRRLTLRSDLLAAASSEPRDAESDESNYESQSEEEGEEEKEESNGDSTGEERSSSDGSEWNGRRKKSPVRKVNNKQMISRMRSGGKRRLAAVDRSDDDSDRGSDMKKGNKKVRKIGKINKGKRTTAEGRSSPKQYSAKGVLSPLGKQYGPKNVPKRRARPSVGRGRHSSGHAIDKNVALIIPRLAIVKVEDAKDEGSRKKRPSLSKKLTKLCPEKDCGRNIGSAGRKRKVQRRKDGFFPGLPGIDKKKGSEPQDDCSEPNRKSARLAGEQGDNPDVEMNPGRFPIPGVGGSGTRDEDARPGVVGMAGGQQVVVKKEKEEEERCEDEGMANVEVKEEEDYEKNVKKEVDVSDPNFDFYT